MKVMLTSLLDERAKRSPLQLLTRWLGDSQVRIPTTRSLYKKVSETPNLLERLTLKPKALV